LDADLKRLTNARGTERQSEFERLLDSYRPRLRRMIGLRLDRRVLGRVDESDVIQDAFLEATARLDNYLEKPEIPFFLWIRFLASQRVIQLHRQHLGAEVRRVGRELSLGRGDYLGATSQGIAVQIAARDPSPSTVAAREESLAQIERGLEEMDPVDREVLALRHFEQLTNGEVASVLGLSFGTASKRYLRAIVRLREMLKPPTGSTPPTPPTGSTPRRGDRA